MEDLEGETAKLYSDHKRAQRGIKDKWCQMDETIRMREDLERLMDRHDNLEIALKVIEEFEEATPQKA